MTPAPRRALAAPLLLALVALVVAGCLPSTGTGDGSALPSFSQAPLVPANPGANPVDLLAWLFTPVFQALFIALVLISQVVGGNILVAIVILTVVLKLVTTPITRKQLVSSKQVQLLAPEVREIQRRLRSDRVAQQAAVAEFYRQRGVNPASGCLPTLLQMILLIPMYSVFSQGLTNHNVNGMLNVFGFQLLEFDCDAAPVFDAQGHVTNPCLDPTAFGIDWSLSEPATTGLFVLGFGVSLLAIVSSLIQLVASRQMLPAPDPRTADDPNVKVQRQMAYFLPLISVFYGGFLPAGLFVYWIISTVIQVLQQFLFVGFGGIFPILGRHPGFVRDHTPRFPVTLPEPRPVEPGGSPGRAPIPGRDTSAQSTIRPNRSRGGRRGRRR